MSDILGECLLCLLCLLAGTGIGYLIGYISGMDDLWEDWKRRK